MESTGERKQGFSLLNSPEVRSISCMLPYFLSTSQTGDYRVVQNETFILYYNIHSMFRNAKDCILAPKQKAVHCPLEL